MKVLNINSTEVILQNYEIGKGKIIVSDLYSGSYSYVWGAMGSDIESFIKNINAEYFASKLCDKVYTFSGKQTARNIRRHIKENCGYELPWYKFLSGQKELREKLKELEEIDNEYEALSFIENLHEKLDCFDMPYEEGKEFLQIIKDIFSCEPWHFLGEEPSTQYRFLLNLHKELKKRIN